MDSVHVLFVNRPTGKEGRSALQRSHNQGPVGGEDRLGR